MPIYLPMQIKLEQAFPPSRGQLLRGGAVHPVGASPGAAVRRAWRRLLPVALLALAGGCASTGPAVPPAKLIVATDAGVSRQMAAAVAPDWWRGLGDARLSGLIERALEGAPGLKVAQARLARAQALTLAARASFEPQVNGGLDLNRQRFSQNGLIPVNLAGEVRNLGALQTATTWEFDFFGRNQSALEAAMGAQRAAQAEAQAARALLASQVARTYMQLARQVEAGELLRAAVAQREQTLALREQRVRAGLENTLAQRQAQAAVIDARMQSAMLDESITLSRNALAALSAQPPAALANLAPRLPASVALPVPDDVPADLLGRRADLVAARWRVEAAVQDVAVARAQFYPNINLNALVGLSSIGLDRLLRASSLQATVGPAIRLPLFDGGRLRANLRVRQAELDTAIESYNQVLVDAVREVADQLGSLRALGRLQAEHANAVRVADSLLEFAEQRHRGGLGDRLAVLAAQAGVLAQRQQGAELSARLIDTQLALIRALGGGYAAEAPAP